VAPSYVLPAGEVQQSMDLTDGFSKVLAAKQPILEWSRGDVSQDDLPARLSSGGRNFRNRLPHHD
jgi:hypothetical protein